MNKGQEIKAAREMRYTRNLFSVTVEINWLLVTTDTRYSIRDEIGRTDWEVNNLLWRNTAASGLKDFP